jgi:molecular chaperone DnaK (HSP70)
MFKRVELITVLLVCLASVVTGQLIGIDFGTEFTKVAMIHSGAGKAMTIVENQRSERKIETAVNHLINSAGIRQ